MKKIKFRRPFFNSETNMFSHFSYWGLINHLDEFVEGCFKSPAQSNMHYGKEDQQFTGLKDKNGKEIYEGDIVKCIVKCRPNINYYREVVFQYGYYYLVNPDGKMPVEIGIINTSHPNTEIVGNIYENYELIKSLI